MVCLVELLKAHNLDCVRSLLICSSGAQRVLLHAYIIFERSNVNLV